MTRHAQAALFFTAAVLLFLLSVTTENVGFGMLAGFAVGGGVLTLSENDHDSERPLF